MRDKTNAAIVKDVSDSRDAQKSDFLKDLQNLLHLRNYSIRTQEAYTYWLKKFVAFHGNAHPSTMGKEELKLFLAFLGENDLSYATQQQALSAIVFFYREVLGLKIYSHEKIVTSQKKQKNIAVFTKDEARSILTFLEGEKWLMASLLYGSGLRLLECLKLRVNDLDFSLHKISVRDTHGNVHHQTILPECLTQALLKQIDKVRFLHNRDLKENGVQLYLPSAIAKEYPNENEELRWYYLFPADHLAFDRKLKILHRPHRHETTLQRAVKSAIYKARIDKHASCSTFRHSFAVHLLEDGCAIQTVQQYLGHQQVNSTMVYTCIVDKHKKAMRSPLDEPRQGASRTSEK